MSLPVLNWREVLKALAKKGFRPIRQKGSHIMVEDAKGRFVVVPRKDEIKRGTLLYLGRGWVNQRGVLETPRLN